MQKTIALITVLVFSFSCVCVSPGYAVVETPLNTPQCKDNLRKVDIPSTLGRFTGTECDKPATIINIQDLHCHEGAQRNIAEILSFLDKKYGIDTIFVEGASGKVDVSWLTSIKDTTVRKALVESLLRQGELTGAEYYAVQAQKPVSLRGLEDESLYKDNLRRMAGILGDRPLIERDVAAFRKSIEEMQKRYYSFEHRRFDRKIKAHRDGRISDEKYFRTLLLYATRLNTGYRGRRNRSFIDTSAYVNINNYLETYRISKRLNPVRMHEELKSCKKKLKEIIPFTIYQDLLDQCDQGQDLAQLLKSISRIGNDKHIDVFRGLPFLADYATYIEISESINSHALLREEQNLVDKINVGLSIDVGELEVSCLDGFMDYVENALYLRLTPDEHIRFEEQYEDFKRLWMQYASGEEIAEIEFLRNDIERFYQVNLQRNNRFADILANHVDGKTSDALTVVIAGGFHSEGLQAILKNRGISCATIMPLITSSVLPAQMQYENLMKERAWELSQTLAVYLLSNMRENAQLMKIARAFLQDMIRQQENISEKTIRASADMLSSVWNNSNNGKKIRIGYAYKGKDEFGRFAIEFNVTSVHNGDVEKLHVYFAQNGKVSIAKPEQTPEGRTEEGRYVTISPGRKVLKSVLLWHLWLGALMTLGTGSFSYDILTAKGILPGQEKNTVPIEAIRRLTSPDSIHEPETALQITENRVRLNPLLISMLPADVQWLLLRHKQRYETKYNETGDRDLYESLIAAIPGELIVKEDAVTESSKNTVIRKIFSGTNDGGGTIYPDKMLKYLKRGAKIVELGMGEGLIADNLLRRGYTVFGIDISRENLEKAHILIAGNPRRDSMHYMLADAARNIPLADNSIDGFVVHRLMSVFTDPSDRGRVVQEIFRVLKPGGMVSVFDFRKITGEEETYDPSVESSTAARVYERNLRYLPKLLEKAKDPAFKNNINLDESIRWVLKDPGVGLMLVLVNKDGSPVDPKIKYEDEALERVLKGEIVIRFAAIHGATEWMKNEFRRYGFDVMESQAGYGGTPSGFLAPSGGFVARKPDRSVEGKHAASWLSASEERYAGNSRFDREHVFSLSPSVRILLSIQNHIIVLVKEKSTYFVKSVLRNIMPLSYLTLLKAVPAGHSYKTVYYINPDMKAAEKLVVEMGGHVFNVFVTNKAVVAEKEYVLQKLDKRIRVNVNGDVVETEIWTGEKIGNNASRLLYIPVDDRIFGAAAQAAIRQLSDEQRFNKLGFGKPEAIIAGLEDYENMVSEGLIGEAIYIVDAKQKHTGWGTPALLHKIVNDFYAMDAKALLTLFDEVMRRTRYAESMKDRELIITTSWRLFDAERTIFEELIRRTRAGSVRLLGLERISRPALENVFRMLHSIDPNLRVLGDFTVSASDRLDSSLQTRIEEALTPQGLKLNGLELDMRMLTGYPADSFVQYLNQIGDRFPDAFFTVILPSSIASDTIAATLNANIRITETWNAGSGGDNRNVKIPVNDNPFDIQKLERWGGQASYYEIVFENEVLNYAVIEKLIYRLKEKMLEEPAALYYRVLNSSFASDENLYMHIKGLFKDQGVEVVGNDFAGAAENIKDRKMFLDTVRTILAAGNSDLFLPAVGEMLQLLGDPLVSEEYRVAKAIAYLEGAGANMALSRYYLLDDRKKNFGNIYYSNEFASLLWNMDRLISENKEPPTLDGKLAFAEVKMRLGKFTDAEFAALAAAVKKSGEVRHVSRFAVIMQGYLGKTVIDESVLQDDAKYLFFKWKGIEGSRLAMLDRFAYYVSLPDRNTMQADSLGIHGLLSAMDKTSLRTSTDIALYAKVMAAFGNFSYEETVRKIDESMKMLRKNNGRIIDGQSLAELFLLYDLINDERLKFETKSAAVSIKIRAVVAMLSAM